ncbi:amino acid permease [Acidianus infernus]|uniref:Amino acid permease n=1 Tax=Acidianus infernus TaxID=12915 RepID=A0A6A9QHX6_ACIIN|nr:amino acid permease [Acidianus infernus]MUM64840.1 amino acid permease [Acidianus infernus]
MKFLRESTGLVKEFSAVDAFALNFSFLGPAAGVSYPLFVSAFLPNSSWILSVILGAVLMIPLVLNYYLLNALIPRSAGDYIYVSRAFGPFAGSVLGMSLLMSFMMGFPVLAMLEVIMVIVPGLQAIGYSLGNKALIDFANSILSSSLNLFVTTTLIVLIAFLLSSSERYYARTFRYLTFLQIIGTVIMIYGLLTFHYAGINNNLDPKLNTQTFALSSIFVLSLFAFANAPSFFAGEIKKSRKSFLAGYLLSYATATIFALLLIISLEIGIGKENYVSAVISGWNLPISTSSLLSFGALPFIHYPAIVMFIFVTALSWYLLYAMINVGASSRILFSLSFDRLLPAFLADVKRGIPFNALLFSFLVSMIFNYVEVYLGYSVSFAIDGLWFVIWNYMIVAIASIKFYKLDKRILYTSISSVITLSTVVFITLYYGIVNPTFGGVIFEGNFAFDIVSIFIPPIIGAVTYIISQKVRSKQGIKLSLIYKEIPPE